MMTVMTTTMMMMIKAGCGSKPGRSFDPAASCVSTLFHAASSSAVGECKKSWFGFGSTSAEYHDDGDRTPGTVAVAQLERQDDWTGCCELASQNQQCEHQHWWNDEKRCSSEWRFKREIQLHGELQATATHCPLLPNTWQDPHFGRVPNSELMLERNISMLVTQRFTTGRRTSEAWHAGQSWTWKPPRKLMSSGTPWYRRTATRTAVFQAKITSSRCHSPPTKRATMTRICVETKDSWVSRRRLVTTSATLRTHRSMSIQLISMLVTTMLVMTHTIKDETWPT